MLDLEFQRALDVVCSSRGVVEARKNLLDRGLSCLAGLALMGFRGLVQGLFQPFPQVAQFTCDALPFAKRVILRWWQLGGLERSGHLLAILFRRTDVARLH